MEKRVLVAVFLSFLVLFGYQAIFKPKPAPRRAVTPAATPASPGGATGAGASARPGASATQPPGGTAQVEGQASASPAPAQAQPLVADSAERDIVVETQLYRAVISNRGARVTSWTLKKYQDLQTKAPLELVPRGLPGDAVRPFELRVDDETVNARLKGALFRPGEAAAQATRVDATKGAQTVTFTYGEEGLEVRKVFTFEPNSYIVRFDADVTAGGRALNPTIHWGPGLGDLRPGGSSYEQKPQGMVFRPDAVDRIDAGEVAKGQAVQEGPFQAAGVDDLYFITLVLPVRAVRVQYESVVVPAPDNDPKLALPYMAWSVRQAQSPEGLRFYVGPKDFDTLKSVHPRLVKAINFGILDWLAVPLLDALNWIHGYAGNYGWAILILTVLINLLMFPLRHKSMVSMRKMQAIQPEVKAIQERYGKLKTTDPERQKMNTELMNLYRERGVNPASGCVPMILTFPVLFAFYALLSQAIEMRGAPFILWIHDLSKHDPYYVTPLMMGASQVWQQRMTPAGGDPMQQKMMMMMPIVFTFMFLWAPSGLVLYWFTSNVLAIGQQYVTNHLAGAPPKPGKAVAAPGSTLATPSPAPPVARRKKK
jgi:YidC/Oxa1 family membrane protein insertase